MQPNRDNNFGVDFEAPLIKIADSPKTAAERMAEWAQAMNTFLAEGSLYIERVVDANGKILYTTIVPSVQVAKYD